MARLRIRLKKSYFGRIPKHRRTLDALGLKRIGQVRIKPDNPQIRGMIREVSYLIEVKEEE